MSTFPIKILDFKSAHMFFITMDVEGKKQQKISELIIKDHKKIEDTCSNEIVAVRYNDQYARANILETIVNDQSMVKNYNCWLIDFGQRIICNIIYQLPKYIQNIEPNCKIASLSNFCYLNSILELGIKGSITSNQTCCASSGVIKCTFDLISTSDKIVFDLKQEIANVLLIGDLLIHKDDTILSLSEQLERRGLITRSESVFQASSGS
ncbi:hypothetical protein ABEB36_011320 [Hypothenemus hampei]|uniref:Uncharacterized protein n=1 Tax=Hypothenemus hampei TaxID=57062 RepID=A0ABD1EF07_HYPHA